MDGNLKENTKSSLWFLNNFFQQIFRISSGCPIANFYWQTGFLQAGNLILLKKLNFYHHLSNFSEDSLGRIILDLQIQNSLPGLHQELEKHILKITDQDIRSISKNVWQRKTKTYINEKNRQDPLEDIKGYKKLDFEKLSKESFERKPHFYSMNLEYVRMKF